MGENSEKSTVKKEEKAKKTQKKSWIKGLQAEYKKIVWPDRNELTRQTTAVVMASVGLCAIIAVIDTILKMGIDLLVK